MQSQNITVAMSDNEDKRIKDATAVFACADPFRLLSGRWEQQVVIGDGPDARNCRLLYLTHVENNWPSQESLHFPKGYIRFANGKLYNYARGTVGSKAVYIFMFSNYAIRVLWNRQTEITRLENWVLAPSRALADLNALSQLIRAKLELGKAPLSYDPSTAVKAILSCLPGLGIVELRELADMLEAGFDQAVTHQNDAA